MVCCKSYSMQGSFDTVGREWFAVSRPPCHSNSVFVLQRRLLKWHLFNLLASALVNLYSYRY